MARKQEYKAQELIDAARDTGGNKTAAAKLLGCTRQTVDIYCNRYKTVKQAFEDERETMVDYAESGLRNAVIVAKAPWAIKFILKTLGKDRGYTERTEQEITGKDGGPIETKDVTYTDDQRANLISAIIDRARTRDSGPDTGQ